MTHCLAFGKTTGALKCFDSEQEEEENVRMSHDTREEGGWQKSQKTNWFYLVLVSGFVEQLEHKQ